LIAVGLGVALRARAMDDPALASLALQAALLCALAHAAFKPLLFLGAGAVKQATGTTSLNWLGGLMRAMPHLGMLMLVGAAGMAALPLGPGFAPEFLLLHAVIASAGAGGVMAWIGFTVLLGVLGLSAALALAAAVRIIGIGFLEFDRHGVAGRLLPAAGGNARAGARRHPAGDFATGSQRGAGAFGLCAAAPAGFDVAAGWCCIFGDAPVGSAG
jgi:formate hydrogenlyase subunit 3/multisubunit Na+/H+ antiporter MnhD subunit